jgi:hypothetical protein
MSGLIRRILGIKRKQEPKDRFRDESFESEKPQTQRGEYSVPETLNPNGFYAVQIAQAEMYDLGNIEYISHFILYDRKERIAVDVTSDVEPAPLLSETNPAEVLTAENVATIEKYLTGEVKPEFTIDFPQGVNSFVAREISDACYVSLRARMVELRDARVVLDRATNAFRNQATNLRTKYLNVCQNSTSFIRVVK